MLAVMLLMGMQTAVAEPTREPMTVDAFVEQYDAVQARMTAVQDEARALGREISEGITAYRAEITAADQAGERKRGCLPPAGSTDKLDMKEVAASYRSLPRAQRAGSAREAFFAYLDRRYPCPGKTGTVGR